MGNSCKLHIVSFICAVFWAGFCGESAWGRAADAGASPQSRPCWEVVFARVEHVVCEIDPRRYRINLHWKDASGRPYGTLGAVERDLELKGYQPIITMNAGMYEDDLSPVGLFVAEGAERHSANLREGNGNFYLKPNGVFYMKGRTAGVMETKAFLQAVRKPDIATQSGPLLVAKGSIHPRFEKDGSSRKIRNGIGIRRNGTVVLAISKQGISFGQFARLFRDGLQCADALYLDGAISRLSLYGEDVRADERLPSFLSERLIGPIISVSLSHRD